MSAAVPQPKYRKQKANQYDRTFIVLNGRRVYLGCYRYEEIRQKYDQIVSEWLASGVAARQYPPIRSPLSS